MCSLPLNAPFSQSSALCVPNLCVHVSEWWHHCGHPGPSWQQKGHPSSPSLGWLIHTHRTSPSRKGLLFSGTAVAPGRFQLSMRHDLTGQQQMAAGCAMLPSSLSPLSSLLPSLSTSPPAPNPVLSAWVFHALAGFCPQEGGCPVCEHHKASPGLEEEEPSAAFLEEEEHYSVPGRRGALCSIPGSDNLHQSLQPTMLHTGSHGHLCASPRLLPPRRKNEHVAERTSPHTDRGREQFWLRVG